VVSAGGGFQVEEGFPGEFGGFGIRVAQQPNQRMEPRKLRGLDTDDSYGFGHGRFSNQLIGGRPGNLNIHDFGVRADKGINEGVVMDITAINRGTASQHAAVPVIPAEQATENREVVQAVKAVNGTEMFGPENELRYQQDPETHRLVVRVVNRKTLDVVSQVPAEYILRLSEDLKRR
jgi:uncharacterized FlaG/YvyC family protein